MARLNVTRRLHVGGNWSNCLASREALCRGSGTRSAFEARIAMGLSAFLLDMDPRCDLFLLGSVQGTIAGSLVVDGHSPAFGEAQFRWFIVHPWYDPDEVYQSLVAEALRFCWKRTTGASFSRRKPTQISLEE